MYNHKEQAKRKQEREQQERIANIWNGLREQQEGEQKEQQEQKQQEREQRKRERLAGAVHPFPQDLTGEQLESIASGAVYQMVVSMLSRKGEKTCEKEQREREQYKEQLARREQRKQERERERLAGGLDEQREQERREQEQQEQQEGEREQEKREKHFSSNISLQDIMRGFSRKGLMSCSPLVQDLVQTFSLAFWEYGKSTEGATLEGGYSAGYKAMNHCLYGERKTAFKQIYVFSRIFDGGEMTGETIENVLASMRELIYNLEQEQQEREQEQQEKRELVQAVTERLTKPEKDTLYAMASGKGCKLIAKQRGVSPQAVKKAMANIRKKGAQVLREREQEKQ